MLILLGKIIETLSNKSEVKFKMVRPDYRNFIGFSNVVISHSAKGSTWEDHKYIKRVEGTYYYPDSYEGGRHLPDGEESDEEKFNPKEAATEFNKFLKLLSDSGQAYFGNKEEWEKMDIKDFKELYKDILGRDSKDDLSDDALEKMFESVKNQNLGIEEAYSKDGLSSNDIENLAKEVVRGNFGNGQVRKDLLGENYEKIQNRVNELTRGSAGSKKVSEASESSVKKAEEIAKKVSTASTSVSKSIDINQILSVYNKK